MNKRTYNELISYINFSERLEYLKLNADICHKQDFFRFSKQLFYKTPKWKQARSAVILRDNGCDLGIESLPILGKILVHHINPINIDDIEHDSIELYNPDNLICVSHNTHNLIHYKSSEISYIERKPNDTILWR